MSEEEILKECTELAENEHHELGDCWDEEYSSSAIFGLIMLYKQTKKSEEVLANKLQEVNIELEKYKRLAEMNLKDSEEFQNNMCEHRCILNNQIMELTEELNNLKEIEKSHQEENGKLRVELEQEKEKNKDLEEKLKIAVAMLTKGTYPEENEGDNDFDKYYISKDIIKDIQGRLFVQLGSYVRNEASPEQERIAGGINIINEILEEK